MFTRHVSFNLKESSAKEFARLIEHDVTPVLHRQKGFPCAVIFI
jgi:hypothetical protein